MTVSSRGYGQYCGFARALEAVGERWALLIVRDLLVGGKRFGELQRGLPRIPSNVLATRLRELEGAGVVRRSVRPRPDNGIAYELTPEGRALDEAVIALGRWGAKRLGEPQAEEVVTTDSFAMALRTIFRPECAAGEPISYEVRVGDEIVVNARVRNGAVVVERGPLPEADLAIEGGPEIRALLAGEISPRESLRDGLIRIRGKHAALVRFVRTFRI